MGNANNIDRNRHTKPLYVVYMTECAPVTSENDLFLKMIST